MLANHLAGLGIHVDPENLHVDWSPARLIEVALTKEEGILTSRGSLAVVTGKYTGRAPKNRFLVDRPSIHDQIAWGKVNAPMEPKTFDRLLEGVTEHLSSKELFVVRALAGAKRSHSRTFMVVAERASQALFATQMLVRPSVEELKTYKAPNFTVLAAPTYGVDLSSGGPGQDACVAIDLERGIIVVAGTGYSGEIKKSIFSTMNYLLPVQDDVLPMHCSCNADPTTGDTAVFFGLSGTGKTTLSADPTRVLIGDDEHGWGADGVFNIEGGCYAKCIGLSAEHEPFIYGAATFGSLTENVVVDPITRMPDYDDGSLTENTRCAYPIEHIANANLSGSGQVPSVVIFLTADAFGVLPPVSRLDEHGAMYHFMTGFTSKVAGTEEGIAEPVPTFSALFGEPFMPLDPLTYATMLSQRIKRGHTRCYLVNTGWTGGGYGTGHRISIAATRALVGAALSGELEDQQFVRDELFNLDVPVSCPGVDPALLNPRSTWANPEAYDRAAAKLAHMFRENFSLRYPNAPAQVRDAGPRDPNAQ